MRKGNKYNNKKVIVDGIKFDSETESKYYLFLKRLKADGHILDFKLQPEFLLQEGFKKRGLTFHPVKYRADFQVWFPDGTDVVVDIKGFETADFKIKRKLFEKKYPQELKLITWSNPDGGWIELADLKKARKLRKQLKEEGK